MPNVGLHKPLLAFCILACTPLVLSAGETAKLPSSPGFEQLLKMALALLVVLAVVLVLARLLKSMRGYAGSSDLLEVIGQLPLGTRERLLIVRVDGKRLLLGVSAAGISRLHELSDDVSTVPQKSASDFANQLRTQEMEQNR